MVAVDSTSDRCSWCGTDVPPGDGFRVAEHPGARHAVFCRLEHIVPWVIQGAHWEPGKLPGVDPDNAKSLRALAKTPGVGQSDGEEFELQRPVVVAKPPARAKKKAGVPDPPKKRARA
mgnify:CR=1 FL=1